MTGTRTVVTIDIQGSPLPLPEWFTSMIVMLLRGWCGESPSICITIKEHPPL